MINLHLRSSQRRWYALILSHTLVVLAGVQISCRTEVFFSFLLPPHILKPVDLELLLISYCCSLSLNCNYVLINWVKFRYPLTRCTRRFGAVSFRMIVLILSSSYTRAADTGESGEGKKCRKLTSATDYRVLTRLGEISHDILDRPPARSSPGRRIGEDLFKYPSVSGFNLLVVALVNTGLFEAVSLIERLPSCV